MRLFKRPQAEPRTAPATLPSVGAARGLVLARLTHQAGPEWSERYSDPLAWLEQVYYRAADDRTRAHLTAALDELLREPGCRWAALVLARTLRLSALVPTLLQLAHTGELRSSAEGQCGDLGLSLIVALDELEVREAIACFLDLLDAPAYAVPACLALLRLEPDLVAPNVARVAAASLAAADLEDGNTASIGIVLAATLRDRDAETFLALVECLADTPRAIRLHTADALRQQTELGARPELEAKARKLLLHDG